MSAAALPAARARRSLPRRRRWRGAPRYRRGRAGQTRAASRTRGRGTAAPTTAGASRRARPGARAPTPRRRRADGVDEHASEPRLHRGALAEERGVHRRDELIEAIVEPEHVEVFDVGVGVLELVGRRVAHRADRHALPLLARAHQRGEEVAIAREEHGDVEGAGHRRVVKHVDGERDVDALLLRAGERGEVHLEVDLLHRAEHLLPLARHLLLLAETREDEDAHHLDGALRVGRVPRQLGGQMVGDDLGDLAEVDVVVLVPPGAELLDDRAALPALEQRVVQPRAVDGAITFVGVSATSRPPAASKPSLCRAGRRELRRRPPLRHRRAAGGVVQRLRAHRRRRLPRPAAAPPLLATRRCRRGRRAAGSRARQKTPPSPRSPPSPRARAPPGPARPSRRC